MNSELNAVPSVVSQKFDAFRWCRLRPRCKARGGGDAVASSTTSNAADRPQPTPALRVAGGEAPLARRRSSTMSRIACVAAPRKRWLGARNEMRRTSDSPH